jgi:hypothetical protein
MSSPCAQHASRNRAMEIMTKSGVTMAGAMDEIWRHEHQ